MLRYLQLEATLQIYVLEFNGAESAWLCVFLRPCAATWMQGSSRQGLDFIGVILSNKYNEVKKRQESWGVYKGYIKIPDPGM